MNILVTAGNTMTLIDQVRGITNVFSGRTGGGIALLAASRGHSVTLLTSRPEALRELAVGGEVREGRLTVEPYKTFSDLQSLMETHVTTGGYDVIVHSAAVSDYDCVGVFAPAVGVKFDPTAGNFERDREIARPRMLLDRRAGKVKSSEDELWLRLVPTPKLVDKIRAPWGFKGFLVKFKLEVGISDDELLRIAEASRQHSGADLVVANTYETMATQGWIGPLDGKYERVDRTVLSRRLVAEIERRGS